MLARVYMTVLSEAQLDAFKLALTEFGDLGPVRTVSGKSTWATVPSESDCLGTVLMAGIEVAGEEGQKKLREKICSSLGRRNVQFLSLFVVIGSSITWFAGTIQRPRNGSGDPYRTSPSEEGERR